MQVLFFNSRSNEHPVVPLHMVQLVSMVSQILRVLRLPPPCGY